MEAKEIWELLGPSWRLPLSITWYDEMGEITIPITLLKKQREAMDKVLEKVTFDRAGKRWIYKVDLTRIAHRSDRSDPEDVVEWLPVRPPSKTDSFTHSSFLAGYCSSTFAICRDPTVMDAIWVSFCKYMLHHFINEEKEVDFGFFKIIPLFARKNWANVAAKWERVKYKVEHVLLKSDFLNPSYDSMKERGVLEQLSADQITSYDAKNKVIRPTLEIIIGSEFYEASIKRELARKRAWRAHKYWKEILERLKRQLPLIMEAYAEHLREAAIPYCNCFYRDVGQGKNKRRRAVLYATPKEPSSLYADSDILFSGDQKAGEPTAENSETGSVSGLPDLQSIPQDMRNGGGDIYRSD